MELKIEGIVDSKVFYNESNHYGVFRIVSTESNDRPITIVGHFYNLELDSFYEFLGSYVENQRFGMQFNVASFRKLLPIQEEYVVRYLSGASFPGIGKITASIIVEHCGSHILETLRLDPDYVLEVPNVSKEKADLIQKVVRSQSAIDGAIQFLNTHGIVGKTIQNILSIYGDQTQEKLETNPYRMIEEVTGVGFTTADKLGGALGFEFEHPFRVEGYMTHWLKTLSFDPGHSFISKSDLFDRMHDIPEMILDSAYESLIKRRVFVEDDTRLYHYTQYDAEVSVSKHLVNHSGNFDMGIENFDISVKYIEKKMGIHFDEDQRNVMKEILNHSVVLLTGGPGTGKSTLLAGFISLIQSEFKHVNITLCAPTGRAAKRLESLTKVNAATIHSVLKWNLHTNVFGMNSENPLDTDIVIVDEFSMVDIWLLSKLLDASANVKKFVFVGDKDQLPSVGPGYVLGDLLRTDAFPIIELTHNYRQAQGSEVIDLAMQMNRGTFDVSEYTRDVRHFDSRYGTTKDIVLKLVREAMERGYTLNDIQVLSPIYNGSAGIDNLNYFLQKECNPESNLKRSIQVGARVFREGDKILQLKNQPDDGVYNGDIGELIDISEDRVVTVDFDGILVSYDSSNFINISHAYAMSVHKSQGSEYPVVIILASLEFRNMLSRKLYYTAVTRSSKAVILVGDLRAFQKAVNNNHETIRNTYLSQRIEILSRKGK